MIEYGTKNFHIQIGNHIFDNVCQCNTLFDYELDDKGNLIFCGTIADYIQGRYNYNPKKVSFYIGDTLIKINTKKHTITIITGIREDIKETIKYNEDTLIKYFWTFETNNSWSIKDIYEYSDGEKAIKFLNQFNN